MTLQGITRLGLAAALLAAAVPASAQKGDGYLFHGTPLKNSIGLAATHGCIRLRDEDIEWMYENVPVGTKVYIF